MSIACASLGFIAVLSFTRYLLLLLFSIAECRCHPALSVLIVNSGLLLEDFSSQKKHRVLSYGFDWDRVKEGAAEVKGVGTVEDFTF